MSVQNEPYAVGQKVHLLMNSGLISSKRFEIVRIWRYPTTFRYLLDTGYVADHSEVRASEGGEQVAVQPVVAKDVDAPAGEPTDSE